MIVKVLRRIAGRILRALGLYSFYERQVIPFLERRVAMPAEKAYYWLRFRNKPVVLSTAGHEIKVTLDSANTRKFAGIFVKFEGAMLEFLLSKLEPGDCVWDVGANRGMYSLFFGKQVGPNGRVYSFEPEERAF